MGSAILDLLLKWVDGPIELLPLRITELWSKDRIHLLHFCCMHIFVNYKKCLQCFDAVGWAAGRASGL